LTRSSQSEEKLEGFINKLASLGYRIEEVGKKPQIYSINGELVNIRSRSKHRNAAYGISFWYSVTFNVLHQVKWVIYLTTESDYFIKFPSSFLENLKDHMYPDKSNAGVGVFDIDWDNEMIVLKQGERVSIRNYYHNLIDEDYHPFF
jgi:hypothetical protein